MQLRIQRLGKELLRFLVMAALALITIGAGAARADSTWTQTSQADFESGTLFQVDTASPGDLKLAMTGAGGNYIYTLRGNNTDDFWRYDISTNSWSSRADAPGNVAYGGTLDMTGVSYQSWAH